MNFFHYEKRVLLVFLDFRKKAFVASLEFLCTAIVGRFQYRQPDPLLHNFIYEKHLLLIYLDLE